MTDTAAIAQARALVDAAATLPADLVEYDPPRSKVLEHEQILWADNPDADPDDVAETLRSWRVEQATERKDAAERRAAQLESARLARRCALPGCESDGKPRVLFDLPSEAAPLGARQHRLCDAHAAAVAYAIGRRTYEADPARLDAYADTVVEP